MTNIDRQIRRNRGYVLAAIAALVVVEALTWGLFNVVSGFLFPVDELSRATAHLLIGLAWLITFMALFGYRRHVDLYLLEQDLYGCELLIGGALEQRRRIALAEQRELAEEGQLFARGGKPGSAADRIRERRVAG